MFKRDCMLLVLSLALLVVCSLSESIASGFNHLSDVYTGNTRTTNSTVGSENINLISRWPYGPNQAVKMSGSYAHIGNGSSYQIIDVSNVASAFVVGEIDLNAFIVDMALHTNGEFAYVLSNKGLHIIDISNPQEPVLSSEILDYPSTPSRLKLLGNQLFVAAGPLYIYSLSVPTSPAIVLTYDEGDIVLSIEAVGQYVFVGHRNIDIHILDISNLDDPQLLSTISHTDFPKDMKFYLNYLFVAHARSGVLQYDLNNISSPFLHTSLSTEGTAQGMDIKNSHLFLAAGNGGLQIIDLRNLLSISVRKTVSIDGTAMNVSVTSDGLYAMVAGYEKGMVMVNIEYIPSAFYQHYYNTPGELHDIFFQGNYAYLAATDGMYILNIANPVEPVFESYYDPGGDPIYSVAVKGDYAYLGKAGTIECVDVYNKKSPMSHVTSSSQAGIHFDMIVDGNYLITAAGTSGIRNWGIGSPSSITYEGEASSSGDARGVDVLGDVAYIANLYGGVKIFSNTVKTAPSVAGTYGISGYCAGLRVHDNLLFIPQWGPANGIDVLDLTSPASPTLESSINLEFEPSYIAVDGSFAYLASRYDGLRVLDIRDMKQPNPAGFFETGDSPRRVDVMEDNIYVLDYKAGLYIFKEAIPPAPPLNLQASGANPSPWQNNDRFSLTWENPPDPSGISAAKYKAGQPPANNNDFTGELAPEPPQNIIISKEGITPVHLWLVDGNGAESFENAALAELRYDISIGEPHNFQESHDVINNVWQNQVNRAGLTWEHPEDLSGIAHYRVYFGTNPAGEEPADTCLAPEFNVDNIPEGAGFLRLETQDVAGNAYPWNTYFVFKYDTTDPRNPNNVTETHDVPDKTWQNDTPDPAFTWSGAVDALSGVKHYLAYFGENPDALPEVQLRNPAFDPPPAPNGIRYLRLVVEDSAGNRSDPYTAFIFQHDGTPPANPTVVLDLAADGSENEIWQNRNDNPYFSWEENPGIDTLSGVKGYYLYWGRDSEGTSSTNFADLAVFDPAPVDTGAHFLRIQTVDHVDNTAHWATVYTFLFDNIPPSVTAQAASLSTREQISVSWATGMDKGGSRLNGRYDIRIREDDGAWKRWRTNYEGIQLDTTGRHGHIYHFEVAGRDHAGNVEEFTGIPEASTEIDTTLSDKEAPGMPIELTANGDAPSPWFNATEFELVWTNPEDLSGITGAFFKLDAPPQDEGDYTDKRSGTPPVYVTATREGGQNLYLWLEDGSGNSDLNNHAMVELRMDRTPPEGITALSRSIIDSLEFTVTWSKGSDKGGSGLSGIYDVNVKVDNGAWEPWQTGFERTEARFLEGRHNHTYSFEARGYDIAGNREEFTGTPESVTFVDTTADIDYVPPQAPGNLAALPGNWNNENDFSLSWTNPTGDDVISGAYYKVGAPASDQDGTFIAGNITGIHGVTLPGEGMFTVYVWLRDLAGNLTHTNAANVQIGFDETPPDIDHTAITTHPAGSGITISAHAEETLSGLNHFYLNYCKTGDHAGIISADFSGDQAVIPAAAVTQRGVEYAIVADDLAGNKSSLPASGFFLIQTEVGGDGGILRNESGEPLALHDGNTVNDYRLFSVPLDLVDKKPKSVFEDDLDAYDPKIWRLYDIDNETLIEYPSFADQPVMHPGKAFLLILNVPGKIVDSGPGVSANAASYCQINLQSGWNLVGNPFDYDIPVDSLSISASPAPIWYLGNTGWISNPPLLKKWEGLAIDVDKDAILTIALGGGTGSQYAITDRFTDDNWGVRIQAIGSVSKDTDNFFGVYAAMPEDDLILMKEPPRLAGSVALHARAEKALNKPVSNTDKTRYAMILKEKNEQGHTWNLHLEGEQNTDEIRLECTHFGDIPEEFQLFLIDPVFKMAYDLSETQFIETKVLHDNTHRLLLIAGTVEYIQSHAEGISLSPLTFDLRPNFPNPFNPDTRIIFTLPDEQKISLEVFNLLGQKIRTLYDNRILKAGYHMTGWDGRNEAGNRVASGLYVIRLRSGKDVKLRKAILMR